MHSDITALADYLVAGRVGRFRWLGLDSTVAGMDAIDRLKAQALARRDAAVRAAELDYAHALKEIRAVARRIARDSPRPRSQKRFKRGSAVALAEAILRERGPLTLLELAVAVQEAGFRAANPRALVSNLRAAMRYHGTRFWERAGVWGVG
jgi:hypothetical protein